MASEFDANMLGLQLQSPPRRVSVEAKEALLMPTPAAIAGLAVVPGTSEKSADPGESSFSAPSTFAQVSQQALLQDASTEDEAPHHLRAASFSINDDAMKP